LAGATELRHRIEENRRVGVGYFHVNQKRGLAGRRPAASSSRHCVVYLGLETHAQIERLIVRDGREFGSGSRSANSS